MTNNKQQTAVDLFHDKVNELIIGKKTITSNDLGKIWLECKEMEREQIIEAHQEGQLDERDYWTIGDSLGKNRMVKSQMYYNETYGGNK